LLQPPAVVGLLQADTDHLGGWEREMGKRELGGLGKREIGGLESKR
jgi:hypothetical protein